MDFQSSASWTMMEENPCQFPIGALITVAEPYPYLLLRLKTFMTVSSSHPQNSNEEVSKTFNHPLKTGNLYPRSHTITNNLRANDIFQFNDHQPSPLASLWSKRRDAGKVLLYPSNSSGGCLRASTRRARGRDIRHPPRRRCYTENTQMNVIKKCMAIGVVRGLVNWFNKIHKFN